MARAMVAMETPRGMNEQQKQFIALYFIQPS